MSPDLRSLARRVPGIAPLAVMILMAAPPAVAQLNLDPGAPISLDADRSDFDRQRNLVVFTGLKLSQGPLQISADRAQASQIDFENSEWLFEGNVRIETAQSELRASEATLTFVGFRLTRAVANGTPAEFEDSGTASGRLIRGRAGQLEYDLTNGVIRLSDGAWLAEGENEITGATLVYDIPDERILAEGEGDRVRIRIVPSSGDNAAGNVDPDSSTGDEPAPATDSGDTDNRDEPAAPPGVVLPEN